MVLDKRLTPEMETIILTKIFQNIDAAKCKNQSHTVVKAVLILNLVSIALLIHLIVAITLTIIKLDLTVKIIVDRRLNINRL
jgi:hypothetical protein